MSFLLKTLGQRVFSTSTRARATIVPLENMAAAHLTATANAVPKLGRIAKWYLPTMALIAAGMTLSGRRTASKLEVANGNIGFGVTNHLHALNCKVHLSEPTQEEKNMMLLDMYGERSSLEDMERAIAGIDSRAKTQRGRNEMLEEAYGDKSSVKDLYRAMEMYEVQ
ncbi:hypothetical protein EK21DRAFT_103987 [Setomelanomma holmii]|uniref:Uncharacterized protein n=1 Tax=Setomelanomma holmii TaxID=210430 RepID=A0A9P4H294_9PLEO|nr:hypothetical protein EK21DRAFT_103987 [Setomelanomma holmii]